MTGFERILPAIPLADLAGYVARGGGRGVQAARAMSADEVIDVVDASGLRGRGGAGFPAGRKWRTVAANESATEPATVVVNGAEGEPGAFKDRAIMQANPYAVLEGGLIAAHAVGALEVIVAMQRDATGAASRIDAAIGELEAAGWCDGVKIAIFEGPPEYLYGEETALLETIDGRFPFPRIAPPFRRGVDEIVDDPADVASESSSAAHVEFAGVVASEVAPPTLVTNVETIANVAGILAEGAEWFRSIGTAESPGTLVCTVSGRTQSAGVAEFPMGTPLREVIETLGGALDGHHLTGAMSGVSNAIVPESLFDTPLTYEAMSAIGSGLGAAGFIVFDDTTDFAGVAAGVSRFLAVESCGQCRHCKEDGLELADLLARIAESRATAADRDRVDDLLEVVTDGARCNLPYQQQAVVRSVLTTWSTDVDAHLHHGARGIAAEPIAAIAELAEGRVVLDERQAEKQPDWSYDEEYSGQWPADRLDEHRAPEQL
jgi:NADH-quinone oxidoreductase subunit F